MHYDTPIFIIARDRLNCLADLVEYLWGLGYERIHIVDNDSAYEPLLEWYQSKPFLSVHYIDNVGPIGPWHVPELHAIMEKEKFIVTDPDLYPSEECPSDLIERMHWVLDNVEHWDKVGPSLNIFNLPDHYAHKQQAIKWERQFWSNRGPHDTWNYPIDTTFALLKPGTRYKITEALRLNRPYMVDHTPWYLDFDNLPEDEAFYLNRLNPQISNWNRINLPKTHVI
jgi:hypothetical protein